MFKNLIGTEISDVVFGSSHQNLTWQEAFTQSVTGAVTGAFSGMNPEAEPVVGRSNGILRSYSGLGLRIGDDQLSLSVLENLSLYNFASFTGGSIISSLLNGSLKLNVPLGPVPLVLTLGKHQNLIQFGANVPGLFTLATYGFNNWGVINLIPWED